MKLIHLTTTDPTFNLAVEELLARETEEQVFMLWRNRPSIIIGRNQNTAAEIAEDFVRENQLQVVRRITGGGAVFHDLGNINYSCISLEREWGQESAAGFTAPIISALRALGIEAEYSGRNDILANGRKVSGCARSVPKEHTLFHGTLLFDTKLDMLAGALRPDPEKIRSKGIKSVRARVGNLREMLPAEFAGMDMDAFVEHLKKEISACYGNLTFAEPSAELCRRAELLAEKKYRTWDWNYGTAIPYEVQKRLRFAGGMIQAEFNVRDNKIESLRFSGDFFGTRPAEELAARLQGMTPQREELLDQLAKIDFQEFIAGITLEEICSILTV